MKFISLNPKYIIRESAKNQFVLFKWTEENTIFNLKTEQFMVFKKCDGTRSKDQIAKCLQKIVPAEFVHLFLDKYILLGVLIAKNKKSRRIVVKLLPKEIERNLRFVQWEISSSCNLRCRHCYNEDFLNPKTDLSTKQCFSLVDQMDRLNTMVVQISGGEPLMRKDLFKIIKRLEDKQMCVSVMFSNALLLNKKMVKKINNIRSDCRYIFSMDGIDDESYDFIRGKGMFRIFLSKMKYIKMLKKGLAINVMVHRKNVDKMDAMMDFIAKHFPSSKMRIASFNRNEQGAFRRNKNLIGLSLPEELAAYKQIIRKYYSSGMDKSHSLEISNLFKSSIGPRGLLTYDDNMHPCSYVKGLTFTIKPGGDVQWCPTLPQVVYGNAKKTKLIDMMQLDSYKAIASLKIKGLNSIRLDEIDGCSTCRLRRLCGGGCRAFVYPNLNAKDKIACASMDYLEKEIIPLLPEKTKQALLAAIEPKSRD